MSYYIFLTLNGSSNSLPSDQSFISSPSFITDTSGFITLSITFLGAKSSGTSDKSIQYNILITPISNLICTASQSFTQPFTQTINTIINTNTIGSNYTIQNGNITVYLKESFLPDTTYTISIISLNNKNISNKNQLKYTITSPGYSIPFIKNYNISTTLFNLNGLTNGTTVDGINFVLASSTDGTLVSVPIYTRQYPISVSSPIQFNVQNSYKTRGKLCLTNINLLSISINLYNNNNNLLTDAFALANKSANANATISLDSTTSTIQTSCTSNSTDNTSTNIIENILPSSFNITNLSTFIPAIFSTILNTDGSINRIVVTNSMINTGYTNNINISITDPTGSNANVYPIITGYMFLIKITNGGSGYTNGNVVVSINDSSGSGSGAVASVIISNDGHGSIKYIQVTSGSKYISNTTTITINGDGIGATATPIIFGSITSVGITSPGLNYSNPSIYASSSNVVLNTTVESGSIKSITVTNTNNYTYTNDMFVSIIDSTPTLNINNASATLIVKGIILVIQITNGGSGYTKGNVVVSINDTSGSGFGARAIANVSSTGSITSIQITNSGFEYISNTTTISIINTSGYGSGYTNNTIVSIIDSSGSGSGAIANVILSSDGNGSITSINITNGGSGYKSNTTVVSIIDKSSNSIVLPVTAIFSSNGNGSITSIQLGSTAIAKPIIFGSITSVLINNPGKNYSQNAFSTISMMSINTSIIDSSTVAIANYTGPNYPGYYQYINVYSFLSNNYFAMMSASTQSFYITCTSQYSNVNYLNIDNGQVIQVSYTNNSTTNSFTYTITVINLTNEYNQPIKLYNIIILGQTFQIVSCTFNTNSYIINTITFTTSSLLEIIQGTLFTITSNQAPFYALRSSPFYYDGSISIPYINPNPIINSTSTQPISINILNSLTSICGINVLSGNPNISVIVNEITGIGKFFYNQGTNNGITPSFLQYIININTNSWTVNESINNVYCMDGKTTLKQNNYIIPSPCKVVNNNLNFIINNLNTYSQRISISATSYNLLGQSSNTVSTFTNIIYDQASWSYINSKTFLNSASIISTDSNYINPKNYGVRIWSTNYAGNENVIPNNYVQNLMYIDTTNTIQSYYYFLFLQELNNCYYDNSQTLLSTKYKKELLFANGLYVTPSCTPNYYINYSSFSGNNVDYSSITSSSTISYVTFGWWINMASIGNNKFSYVNFVLNNNSLTPQQLYLLNGINYIDSSCTTKPLFYYRFENASDNFGSGTHIPFSAFTTPWINGNEYGNTLVPINDLNFNQTNKLFSGIDVHNMSATPGTFKLIIPNDLTNTYQNQTNLYVYCRIGLQMNFNFSFSSVSAFLSSY